MHELDDVDRTIIEELQHDGRATYQDISKVVGLSGPAVADRIAAMRDAGVITGFSVDLDRRKIGDALHTIITIRVERTRTEKAISLLEQSAETESVHLLVDGRVVVLTWIEQGDALKYLENTLDEIDFQIDCVGISKSPN